MTAARKLPPVVRQGINRLAHQLALIEETRLRQHLTEQARERLSEGTPVPQVLALGGSLKVRTKGLPVPPPSIGFLKLPKLS